MQTYIRLSNLPLLMIFNELPTIELIQKISKLSKRMRKILWTRDPEVLKQRGKLTIQVNILIKLSKYQNLDLKSFDKSLKYMLSITNGLVIDCKKFSEIALKSSHKKSFNFIFYQPLFICKRAALMANKTFET